MFGCENICSSSATLLHHSTPDAPWGIMADSSSILSVSGFNNTSRILYVPSHSSRLNCKNAKTSVGSYRRCSSLSNASHLPSKGDYFSLLLIISRSYPLSPQLAPSILCVNFVILHSSPIWPQTSVMQRVLTTPLLMRSPARRLMSWRPRLLRVIYHMLLFLKHRRIVKTPPRYRKQPPVAYSTNQRTCQVFRLFLN